MEPEQKDGEDVSEQPEQPDAGATELTGHEAVDEVLGSLQGLDNRPVAERVAVFEAAHEALRGALSNAGDRADTTAQR